jgi:hypothetical protein
MAGKSLTGGIFLIIGLAIGVYVLASIMPGALTAVAGATLTSFTASMTAMWGLLGLICVLACVLIVLKYVR